MCSNCNVRRFLFLYFIFFNSQKPQVSCIEFLTLKLLWSYIKDVEMKCQRNLYLSASFNISTIVWFEHHSVAIFPDYFGKLTSTL